jgi:hypothetical protein
LIDKQLINSVLIDNKISNINDFMKLESMEAVWSGIFTLKKNAFPTNFYLLAGSGDLAQQALSNLNKLKNQQSIMLKINQRLRLDSVKQEELKSKLIDYSCNNSKNFSLLLATSFDFDPKKSNSMF